MRSNKYTQYTVHIQRHVSALLTFVGVVGLSYYVMKTRKLMLCENIIAFLGVANIDKTNNVYHHYTGNCIMYDHCMYICYSL